MEPVLQHVSFAIEAGEVCCILGPNGVGKTTLFKTILHLMRPVEGDVWMNGENTARWSPAKRAGHMAYVAQFHNPPFPYKVKDVVILGRLNSVGYFGTPREQDYRIADKAMDEMGVTHLKERSYTDLSGGERQLVMIARALAQEPQVLVMDEPTASLDYGNTIRVLSRICDLRDHGYGIIFTTHAPDHAFLCRANVALLQRGRPLIYGPAVDVITEQNLHDAYGIHVRLLEYRDELGGPMRMCAPSMIQT
ncbi:MAG: ABC transporter ATP-binding protein [Oscillospiraceae bacterium]|nr:ABC transporter ATP-binding protein [Oscillospiraceae bacterium]